MVEISERTIDYRKEREERDRLEREDKKRLLREQKKREEEEEKRKMEEREAKSYSNLFKSENMMSNKDTHAADGNDSDDFMWFQLFQPTYWILIDAKVLSLHSNCWFDHRWRNYTFVILEKFQQKT